MRKALESILVYKLGTKKAMKIKKAILGAKAEATGRMTGKEVVVAITCLNQLGQANLENEINFICNGRVSFVRGLDANNDLSLKAYIAC